MGDIKQKTIHIMIYYTNGGNEIFDCTDYGTVVDFPEMLFLGGIDGNPNQSILIRNSLIDRMQITYEQ